MRPELGDWNICNGASVIGLSCLDCGPITAQSQRYLQTPWFDGFEYASILSNVGTTGGSYSFDYERLERSYLRDESAQSLGQMEIAS